MLSLVSFLVIVFMSEMASAITIHVPSEQPTIQAGIDVAIHGDTVLVAPGLYTGEGNRDIDFGGRFITVKSVNGPQSTRIDCEASEFDKHRGFSFANGEGLDAILDGFTVEGGYSHRTGGGISIGHSSPTIRNCIVINNHAMMGGGISFFGSGARIEGCIFTGNTAQSGGAIFIHDASPAFVNCTFWNNPGLGQFEIENDSYPVIAYSLVVGGEIRVEPPYPLMGIGPSKVFPNCCIYYAGEASSDRFVGSSSQPIGFIHVDPELCDTATAMYKIEPTSPCLPSNNQCGLLIGALDSTCSATAVDELDQDLLPTRFLLAQNYPNPFNSTTTITFELPVRSHVEISVINVLGRRVVTLVNDEVAVGSHTVHWNGADESGNNVATGVYFYRLTASEFVQSRKMLLLK